MSHPVDSTPIKKNSTTDNPPIPTGFKILERRSPFTDLLQPIYAHSKTNSLTLGMRCENKHCNARGFVHGGVLCTLADIALGYNCVLNDKHPGSLLTSNFTIDFAGSANVGDWIEIDVDVQKVGRTLAFANCYINANSKRIARASAVFCKPPSRNSASSTTDI